MNDDKKFSSDQSFLINDRAAKEIRSRNGEMIVGVSNRLVGVFTREEEEYEIPENFNPKNDDDDWLGVD
jgi:hypothetical protein